VTPTSTAKPLRISWSRVRLHSECPAKGHLLATGHKSPVSDLRNFFPGTVADRCMRQWLSLDVQERGWMASQVGVIMDAEEKIAKESGDGVVKWRSSADRAEVREMCTQAVGQLEEDLWTELHLWQPPAYDWDPAPRFEVPLTIPHPAGHKEKIYLVGEIDLLIRRPFNTSDLHQFPGEHPETVIEVWDLKTTRDNQYWRKTLGQLVFYEIAVWGMTKQWPVRSGLFQPLCNETVPNWQFTKDHRVQMLSRIVSVAGDIWAGRLDPKPDKHKCGRCEVRHACPLKGGGRGRAPLGGAVSGA
jgi:hypothetical protein